MMRNRRRKKHIQNELIEDTILSAKVIGKARLSQVTLTKAGLIVGALTKVHASNCLLKGCFIQAMKPGVFVRVRKTRIEDSVVTLCTAEKVDFGHMRVHGVAFADVYFYKCDFTQARFTTCTFSGCIFDGCTFSKETFQNCNFFPKHQFGDKKGWFADAPLKISTNVVTYDSKDLDFDKIRGWNNVRYVTRDLVADIRVKNVRKETLALAADETNLVAPRSTVSAKKVRYAVKMCTGGV